MTEGAFFYESDRLRKEAEQQLVRAVPLALWDGWLASDMVHELGVYHTELKLQNEELQLTVTELELEHQLYHALYEHAPTAYFTLDQHADILNVNQAGAALLEFGRTHLLMRRFLLFVDPTQRSALNQLLATLLETGTAQPQQFTLVRRSGERREVQLQGLTLPASAPQQLRYLITLTDITPLVEAQVRLEALNGTLEEHVNDRTQQLQALTAQFRHQAQHDHLTGLPNRAAFEEALQKALQELHQTGRGFTVLFCDIDHFKRINDSLGHAAGDQVLQELAKRLRHVIRPTDHVARLGGDEFALLMPGGSELIVAARLQEVLVSPVCLEHQDVFVQLSTGILSVSGGYETAEEILKDVDLALYQAKRERTTRFQVFEPALRGLFRDRIKLETELRHALKQNELVVHYQPIVSLRDKHLLGLEALVRWQHPQRGLLSPGDFIPLAEELGLVGQIDRWVLGAAEQQMIAWQREGPTHPQYCPKLWMNVNVSAHELAAVGEVTAHLIGQTVPRPWHLQMEITERVLTHSSETDSLTLQALRQAGVELVVDDFGMGYSSLSTLHRFPVRMLKIDRSFVSTLSENQELVRAIVSMGRALGMTVVAEGIETEEQRDQLIELGVDVGQGYLFAPVLPPDQIGPYLRSGICL
ncbi:putative bifunctional diguanylate cyclase/phosphodiesterase [Deinococcus aquatilis]|uniref:putative bifunctional diguanylate cyclase/phosphodiesterase n=1 Tax=Deinococcus aquatilis TaxID=519440 RepID=UPI000362790E|nr:EAL domain-containing protein [Deinococcus aquatilis]